jgi:hypothetical protein
MGAILNLLSPQEETTSSALMMGPASQNRVTGTNALIVG